MSENTKHMIAYAALVIIILALCLVCGYEYRVIQTPPEVIKTVIETDTVYTHSIDTITVTKIKYKTVSVRDTVYVHKDTMLIVEDKVYEDSISTIYFHGIATEIDTIEYRLPRDTAYITTEITNTVTQKDSFWKNRFVVTAGVGAGYGIIQKKPDIYVGIGVGIRLW